MNKKKLLNSIRSVCSHTMIILGLNLMVLLVLDVFFNQAMNFLGNLFFKLGSMLFIVCGLVLAFCTLLFPEKEGSAQKSAQVPSRRNFKRH